MVIELIENHIIEVITLSIAAVGFVLLTRYKGNNAETKIDNLSVRMDGVQNTLQIMQIENTRTSERTLNTQDQLKEIKEQLKEIKGQHGKNN